MKCFFACLTATAVACSSAEVPQDGSLPDAGPARDATSLDGTTTDAEDARADAPRSDASDAGNPCKPNGDAGPTCFQCCDGQVPNAKDVFLAALANCMPSVCSAQCAKELSGSPPWPAPTPGSACERCVFGVGDGGAGCVNQMKSDCGVQMSCVSFVTCMDECVRR